MGLEKGKVKGKRSRMQDSGLFALENVVTLPNPVDNAGVSFPVHLNYQARMKTLAAAMLRLEQGKAKAARLIGQLSIR